MLRGMLALANAHFNVNGPLGQHVSDARFGNAVGGGTKHICRIRAICNTLLNLLFRCHFITSIPCLLSAIRGRNI